MTDRAEDVGRQAADSDWLDWCDPGRPDLLRRRAPADRLAVRCSSPSATGARRRPTRAPCRSCPQQPFGDVLVWAIAIGMFLLVIWRLLEAFVGHRDKEEGSDRIKARLVSGGKAVLYAAVGDQRAQRGHGLGLVRRRLDLDPDGDGLARRSVDHRAWSGSPSSPTAPTTSVAGSPRSTPSTSPPRASRGQTGKAYLLFGKIGYIGKGIAIAHRGWPDPVRRRSPTTPASPATSTRRCTRC